MHAAIDELLYNTICCLHLGEGIFSTIQQCSRVHTDGQLLTDVYSGILYQRHVTSGFLANPNLLFSILMACLCLSPQNFHFGHYTCS